MSSPLFGDPFPYPGDDPAAVRQAAEDLGRGRARLADLVNGLDGSLMTMVRSWQGVDADAARTEVTTLVRAATGLAGRADDAVAAIGRHGEDLERIRRAVDGLRAEWASAGSPWVPADPLEIWGLGRSKPGAFDPYFADPFTPDPTGTQVWTQLRARWQALVHEQEESVRTCRNALDAAVGGNWQYTPTSGTVRGDLGSVIGLTELTFDERLDAAQAWTELTPEEQALYVALGDDRLATLVAGDPTVAAETWRDLDPLTRQALIHTRAEEIGSVDGVPIEDRDQANRILLPQQRAQLQAEANALWTEGVNEGWAGEFRVPFFGTAERDWLDRRAAVQARLAALDDIAGSTSAGEGPGGEPRHTYLLALDVADRGRVAIAYGNPDTADQVVTLVPGTGSDLGGVLGDAERTKLMMQAAESSGGGTVAGVVWTDWDTPPDLVQAAFEGYADRAADDLGAYAEGLRASHEGDQSFRSVIAAHSYGTVLTAKAASGDHTLNADALILLGSPGTDLPSVRNVRLTGVPASDNTQHVFATSSDADLVGDLPIVTADLRVSTGLEIAPGGPVLDSGPSLGYSGDPTDPDWGATVFHTPADHSLGYYRFSDHGRYWDPESAQLLTMGDIIADRYQGSRW